LDVLKVEQRDLFQDLEEKLPPTEPGVNAGPNTVFGGKTR
jgi:hypothetical protein